MSLTVEAGTGTVHGITLFLLAFKQTFGQLWTFADNEAYGRTCLPRSLRICSLKWLSQMIFFFSDRWSSLAFTSRATCFLLLPNNSAASCMVMAPRFRRSSHFAGMQTSGSTAAFVNSSISLAYRPTISDLSLPSSFARCPRGLPCSVAGSACVAYVPLYHSNLFHNLWH
jgi:hypothetical protein